MRVFLIIIQLIWPITKQKYFQIEYKQDFSVLINLDPVPEPIKSRTENQNFYFVVISDSTVYKKWIIYHSPFVL